MAQKIGAPFGNKNRQSHGMVGTRIYKIWQNMKRRCDSPIFIEYDRYGGRGITYDPHWKTFENFYEDMKVDYELGLSLERIDIDKNYARDNCKWIPRSEQKNNTSKSRYISIDGETKTLRDWAKENGIKYSTAFMRLKRGVDPKRAFEIGG